MTENGMPQQFDHAAIPTALTSARQWLIWRLEHKPGAKKPAKMPYYASGKRRTGQQGSDADRTALVTFDEAIAAMTAKKADGIGFAFLPGDGFIGIDLDNAIDLDTGEISQRAQRIIAACDSYAEWSPSGRGFHIYIRGDTETAKDNGIGVEMFCGRQFFTVTGKHLAGTPTEVKPIAANVLKRLHKTIAEAKGGFSGRPAPASAAAPTDERARIRSALEAIDPAVGYEPWLQIGMALHAELSDEGFGLWDAWSARSDKYPGSEGLRTHWSSFKPGAVKIGTLFHLAKLAGWKPPRQARKAASATPRIEGSHDEWRQQLVRKDDKPVDFLGNIYLIVRNHPIWSGVIWLDDFARRIVKRKPAPWDTAASFVPGVEWSNEDNNRLGLWLAQREGLIVRSQDNLAAAVAWVATESRFHPVRDYLDALAWDGQFRLTDWLTDYLGVKKSEYAMLAGRLFLIGMVARVYQPGCQMRFVPILEGPQFRGKSSALRILGGEWFGDTTLDLNNKDTYQLVQGRWLYEIGELDAFNRTEATRVKAFVSSQIDRFRAPYERAPRDWPRQGVFVGTTNQDEYFKDTTGNTRYWPFRVEEDDSINLDGLAAGRDQLFAEAVALYKRGERWHPTREEQQRLFEPQQEDREIADPWQSMIGKWLRTRSSPRVMATDILTDCLKIEPGKIDGNRQMTTRVGIAMKRLGWAKRRNPSGAREYYYEQPAGWHGGEGASSDAGDDHAPL
jgi:predicted P-loop ATPase